MKQILIPFILVAAFITALGLFMKGQLNFNFLQKIKPATKQEQKMVVINSKNIAVEIAKTSEERSKGLSGKKSLDAESGMLFVFEKNETSPAFWMKDMLIPLDIIWIESGKIIRIDKNVQMPAAKTPDSKLKIYTAGVSVDYVLEVNANYCDTNSIKVGDAVTLPTL
jgi:uncharacterized protein